MTRSPSVASVKSFPARRAARGHRGGGFNGQIAEVDLRLLRVFRTVAERGGFSAAEIALGKSKSSISIDISALENRLNLTLCLRGRSGFSLTAEGRMVLEATDQLQADISRFQQRINDASGVLSGRFCLYVPDNTQVHGETAIIRAIETFTTRHPDVFMDVRSASTREVEFAVLNGQATAGITLYAHHQPDMHDTTLFTERLNLYCGQRHPLFTVPEAEITTATLAAQNMIEVSDAAQSLRWEDMRDRMTFAAAAENVDSRALLILSGNYIGFLPEAFARPLLRDGLLRHISFGDLHLITSFHFLVRSSPETGLMVETFRTILEDAC
ncbi:LysR family transcriptional regulator [Komagataeibacter sp. FNDCR2]|uniref:LysR family transcriptional regulator n=1 Tax=Komagataeibacter sp. FNDCR2 TaxID=2878682 RepID=UPI001E6467DF|nr:LysR family transcriptional regulator [Komagataeibacter sp. FNDCR2]MCE2575214.1 LysR family transcriptional regulator [Komagataeibacter sp. FNDCR2]